MYELAKKYVEKNGYKKLAGDERIYLPDLETGMTLCIPKINTADMVEISFLGCDVMDFDNNVRHTVIAGTHEYDVKFGYWDEPDHKKYIKGDWVYEDPEHNVKLVPDYIGYFVEDDSETADVDQSLSLWVNGDVLVGRDPHSLSRFVLRIEKQ